MNEEITIPKRKKEKKKKSNKMLIIIIILLLTLMAGGSYYVYTTYIDVDVDNKDKTSDVATGGDIIKDYEFDAEGNPIPIDAPNIGMAIKSAILGDVNGKAEMAIKNSGDIPIEPQIIFNGEVIYKSQMLQPGEAVLAKLDFGKLTVGEHDFNVLAMYEGGSGLSLKSKVVVFEPGTEVEIIDKDEEKTNK